MGFIALKGVNVHARIGLLPEERMAGRKFSIDIKVKTSLKKAGETDDIAYGLNYEILSDAIFVVMKKEFKLMEAACRAIAVEVLKKATDIEKMIISMEKTSPFIKGHISASVVEWHYPEDFCGVNGE